MSSSSTQLLDSDLVNEWSELLHHEQELVSSLQHHHGQILENGCYLPASLMRQNKKLQGPPSSGGGGSENSSPSPPTTTTSWIELKSSTKCKAPPIPEPKETPLHKSIRPAPAIPPNVRRKIEDEAITNQPPPRSGSVSRGLQVEEEDLIQFSEPDGHLKSIHRHPSEDSSNSCLRSQGSGRRRNPSHANNNNNAHDKEALNGETKLPLEDDEGHEDLDDDDAISNRTADEQIDYLESLEPCPCYAKCCLDSIITLFCVTLLG